MVEDNPDYEFEAAALDVSALPESINLSDEGPVQSAVVGYMLGKPGSLLGFLKSEATGPLGEAVLVAFAASKGKSLDFFRLRQGLHSRYACSAAFPATLDGFKALYGDYTVWEGETLDSAPKCGQRRIWRRKDGLLSVAETLDETVVRETEVVRSGRADGALDFAVYTGDGNLTNRSTFATHGGGTIVASAPYTCMACHVSPDTMTYDVVFPEGTGACAK